jgi:ParB family chromosome partitioning protein
MKTTQQEIQFISIERIRVLNPRSRDPKKFGEIIDNIQTIGLKRPITVRLIAGSKKGEEHYEIVCGQGRFEAFKASGMTTIPAIVRTYGKKDALLASLVENIARRPVRAIEQIETIRWMQERGQDVSAIEKKTGLGKIYVNNILRLLSKGEERLLDAVLHKRIPITFAIRISESKDEEIQLLLLKAYENGEVKRGTLTELRKIAGMREAWGKQYGKVISQKPRKTTTEQFMTQWKKRVENKRITMKKAHIIESRNLSIVAAFRVLIKDENFLNALRAEKLDTIPSQLIKKLKEEI